jgi:hypothetical protein
LDEVHDGARVASRVDRAADNHRLEALEVGGLRFAIRVKEFGRVAPSTECFRNAPGDSPGLSLPCRINDQYTSHASRDCKLGAIVGPPTPDGEQAARARIVRLLEQQAHLSRPVRAERNARVRRCGCARSSSS